MLSDIAQTFKGLILNPTDELKKLREEPLEEAFIYFLTTIPVLVVLLAIVSALNIGYAIPASIPVPSAFWIVYLIGYIIAMYIACIIGLFISSVMLHIFVYCLGGKKGIDQTIKAVIYSYTPTVILGWIPFVGIIGGIWSLVLEIIAIRELHEISTARATIALILAILTYIFAIFVAVVLAVVLVIFLSQSPTFAIDQTFLPTI